MHALYFRKRSAGGGFYFDPNQLPHGTREELIEYAQTLTKDKDGDGTIDQWGYGFMADNTLHTPHMWLAHVWAGGGDLVDEEGWAIYDSEAYIAAAQFYYDLVNTYEVSPPEVIATDIDASVRALVSGEYAGGPYSAHGVGRMTWWAPLARRRSVGPRCRLRREGRTQRSAAAGRG